MGADEMRALNTIATPDLQSLVKPFDVLSVVDYGDFAVDQMSIELSIGHITAMVAETAGTGAIPMLVGGDTSVLYPGVKGIATNAARARSACCISAPIPTPSATMRIRFPTDKPCSACSTRAS